MSIIESIRITLGKHTNDVTLDDAKAFQDELNSLFTPAVQQEETPAQNSTAPWYENISSGGVRCFVDDDMHDVLYAVTIGSDDGSRVYRYAREDTYPFKTKDDEYKCAIPVEARLRQTGLSVL